VSYLTYASRSVTRGSWYYWPLNDTSGTAANQLTVGTLYGTYVNGPLLAQATLLGDGDSGNGSVKFDGSNDRFEVGPDATYTTQTQVNQELLVYNNQFGSPDAAAYQSFAASIWVKTTTAANATTKRIIHHGDSGETNGWALVYESTHGFRFSRFAGGQYETCDSAVMATAGGI
jgi:hypothetical protein